jgi:hypothetical protein
LDYCNPVEEKLPFGDFNAEVRTRIASYFAVSDLGRSFLLEMMFCNLDASRSKWRLIV